MAKQRETLKGSDAWRRLDYERRKRRTPEGICQAAGEGDKDCARKALRIAAELIVTDPERIPPPVREYLERALLEILSGTDPAQALNLERSDAQRANPPIDFWRLVRDSQLARHIAHLRQQGMSLDAAAREAAASFDAFADKAGTVGYEAARKAYLRLYPADDKHG